MFGAFSSGCNMVLPCHIEDDAKLSVTTVIDNNSFEVSSPILSYFCFPRAGVCVGLRAGDTLIFHPLEPHCVSSRVNIAEDILCVSFYLKTAVVGGNDNSKPLNIQQSTMLNLVNKY